MDKREIGFLNLFRLKQCFEVFEKFLSPGYEKNARGFFVQAVDDARADFWVVANGLCLGIGLYNPVRERELLSFYFRECFVNQ